MEKINKFSACRLVDLTKKTIMDRPRVFMMRFLVLVAGLTIAALFTGFTNFHTSWGPESVIRNTLRFELQIFIFMFYVLGLVYTSLAFSEASTRAGRIGLLMLPARSIEKYLSRWVVYVLLYLILFVVAMFIADALRVAVMSAYYHEHTDYIAFMSIDRLMSDEVSAFLAVFLALQSFFWLGSVMWARNSFIKTFAALVILVIFFTIIMNILYGMILSNIRLCEVPALDGLDIDSIDVLWTICGLACLTNYGLGYLRLKETEVIQRVW